MEILSPFTHRHDRVRKLRLYASAGVQEYWLLQPSPAMAEVREGPPPLQVAYPGLTKPETMLELNQDVSFEQFLELSHGQNAEWVGGKVVPMTPVRKEHTELGGFLIAAIRTYVETLDLGVLLYEPFVMRTGPELPARAPDLMFVATRHLDRLKDKHLEGSADLVIEILSPGSEARDRGEKFYEYEQGGVREYWLLDPFRKQPEFYQLGENGVYRFLSADADGRYECREIPGLWIRVDWLWQRPFPKLLSLLREWKFLVP